MNYISVDQLLGVDNSSCLVPNGSLPCQSFVYALQGFRQSSTQYSLRQGTYILNSSVQTFANLDTIGIYGNFSSHVICTENAGLAFQNVSHIYIIGITFSGCGAVRNSTSRNYSDNDPFALSAFRVGLYFYLCSHVHLNTVVVANSTNGATGVVMYDTVGFNLITDCEFYNNSVPDPSYSAIPGGGGFYVEFTYCSPGDHCYDTNPSSESNSGSEFNFVACAFHDNVATHVTNQQAHSALIIPYEIYHEAFGRGGGLSFFFNGNASYNSVLIVNCNFTNNKALWGGGLFIEFHDTASGNIVSVTGCIFEHNNVSDDGCSGGGVRIGHFVLQNDGTPYNNVTLFDCNFISNYGSYGGGLSIEPALQDTTQVQSVAYFLIQECRFINNAAALGSAIYVTQFPLTTKGLLPSITFYHTLVQGNILTASNPMDVYGAVHIHLVPVTFTRQVLFLNNNGSALALVASYVNFTSCRAEFNGNDGTRGGAIALLGASWLLISSDTEMRFNSNVASIDGGAIYNMYIEKEIFKTSPNCFLKYSNPTLPPEMWTARFTFINNSDSQGQNSIHSTSILPCGVFSSYSYDVSKIFCWNTTYWNYNNGTSCSSEISTDASNVSSFLVNTEIYPGQVAQLQMNVTDDLGHEVINQTVFSGFINDPIAELSPQFTYISSGYVQIYGNGSGNVTLSLNIAGSGQLYEEIVVNIKACPPGLTLSTNNKTAICKCDPTNNYGNIVLCLGPAGVQGNINAPTALLQQGYWMGQIGNDSTLLAGLCPPENCNGANSSVQLAGLYITLPSTSDQLDETICSGNRMGVLCGKCKDGYAPAVDSQSSQCLYYNHTEVTGNVFKYIGAVYVPLVAFFILIILCNVRLTAGPANVFILYSQLIASTFDLTLSKSVARNVSYASALAKSYRLMYGIFNLDFFLTILHPFCVAKMDTLDVISLNYLIALSPLLMIVLMLVFIKLLSCSRSSCLVRCIATTTSPMMAFASFLLLSYNKLTTTSTLVLSQVLLVTSYGHDSAYRRVYASGSFSVTNDIYVKRYAIMAYFFLLIPILLPIVLLEYPVRFLERMLNKVPFFQKHYPADKVNIFLDTFQGAFKNNRRFYASFYFIFRLFIAVEYIVAVSDATQIILQQATCVVMILITAVLKPYKQRYLNYLDVLMFSYMAILGSLSMYMLMNTTSSLIVIPLILQYILVIIPAILYAGIFLVWNVIPYNVKVSLLSFCGTKKLTDTGTKAEESPRYPDEEDVLINRSRETNSYTQLDDSVSEKYRNQS